MSCSESPDFSLVEKRIIWARSVHAALQAGEEWVFVFPRGTFDLNTIKTFGVTEEAELTTSIPDTSFKGTVYQLNKVVADTHSFQLMVTDKHQVLHIYAGDG